MTPRQSLADYYAVNVDGGEHLICDSADSCRSSQQEGRRLAEGQLSYVGSLFGEPIEGAAFRILVLGMQTGEAGEHWSMTDRADHVRRAAAHEPDFLTNHMKGTARALEVLFGVPLGAEYVNVGDERVHVFDCFALVNATLCSATAEQNEPFRDHRQRSKQARSGEPTDAMVRSCRKHLAAAIDFLRPSLVLTQGRRQAGESPSSSLRALADEMVALPANDSLDDQEDVLFEMSIGDHRFDAALLPHPSWRKVQWWRGEGDYFLNTVQPALISLRNRALHD